MHGRLADNVFKTGMKGKGVPEVPNPASGVHQAGINDTSHDVSKRQETIIKRTRRQSISSPAPICVVSRFDTIYSRIALVPDQDIVLGEDHALAVGTDSSDKVLVGQHGAFLLIRQRTLMR